jgi:hypothetical protein
MRGRAFSALFVVLVLAGVARAELSDAVVAAYRGKLILSRAAVAQGTSDKETIAKVKAAQLAELAGKAGEEGQVWRFHYTAFLKKTGNVGLHIKYISGEKDGRLAAESPIPIPDVDAPVLEGDLTITESQGLSRGKAYILQLVNDKNEVVAKTSAIFK